MCPGKNFEGVTKASITLTAENAEQTIADAFHLAVDGQPGPVVLNYPGDLGEAQCGTSLVESRPGPQAEGSKQEAIKERIARSSRPVILAGADVIRAGACAELLALADAIEAAVLVTMDARGVFPETYPRWAGVFLGFFNPNVIESKVLAAADLVLVAGVDAIMTHSPWRLPVVSCELSERPEYGTLTDPAVRVNGHLKSALRRLAERRQQDFTVDEVAAMRDAILPYFRRPNEARLAAQDVIAITRRVLPHDGVLISETSAFVCMLEHLWPVDRPGTYLGTSGGRTMGLMLPAALGTRLAPPEIPMIVIGGDGSLLMRLGELESFARTGVSLPLVIINDQALGTMKSRQRSRGMTDYGLDFRPVDFVAVARACGLHGATVDRPEAFEKELRLAMNAQTATLIDARLDPAV
jgi:acetolactate synthase-1/2/3 large subunit